MGFCPRGRTLLFGAKVFFDGFACEGIRPLGRGMDAQAGSGQRGEGAEPQLSGAGDTGGTSADEQTSGGT